MSRKNSTNFACSQCGYTASKWFGRCPDCGSWGALEEKEAPPPMSPGKGRSFVPSNSTPIPITEVETKPTMRTTTGLKEVDNVLGGGLVEGALILIGGEPGIGKSTILLQTACQLARQDRKILYVSGEESAPQIRMRAERLNSMDPRLYLLAENQLERIFSHLEQLKPEVLVIDSIQTVYSDAITSAPGSVSQTRECALRFLEYAKNEKVPVFLIGHVTKDGTVAGPRVLEHIVDTVLYFEGEKDLQIRILRAVKNRFGNTNELGLFEMTEDGLQEIRDMSFLAEHRDNVTLPGCAYVPVLEGSRIMVVEIQALTHFSGGFAPPRRMASGIDQKKLSLILAVLEKYLGMQFSTSDVYLNVTGGLKITEPAADLAAAFAVWSSFYNVELPFRAAFVGEIGLTGELRAVGQLEKRVRELEKTGFKKLHTARLRKKFGLATDFDLYCTDTIKAFFQSFSSFK